MNFELKKALGRLLKQHRDGKNLTQAFLAKKSGVPLRTVERAEKGGGISKGNLSFLATTLGVDVEVLLRKAQTEKEVGPELRLSFRQITSGEELIRFLRKKGNLCIGPPGEHEFNEYLGENIEDLQSEIEPADDSPASHQKARKSAAYVLAYCKQCGFSVFAVHYREEVRSQSKTTRKPTTIIIAAHERDQRVRKTPKGLVLDYVMDSRRQTLNCLQNDSSTRYDWMQDQLISKFDGAERVETVLKTLNDRIRKETK